MPIRDGNKLVLPERDYEQGIVHKTLYWLEKLTPVSIIFFILFQAFGFSFNKPSDLLAQQREDIEELQRDFMDLNRNIVNFENMLRDVIRLQCQALSVEQRRLQGICDRNGSYVQ